MRSDRAFFGPAAWGHLGFVPLRGAHVLGQLTLPGISDAG